MVLGKRPRSARPYLVLGIWYLVFGIWYLVFGIWYLVFGIWYLVFGIWYLVFGIWYLVFGIWYFAGMVFGTLPEPGVPTVGDTPAATPASPLDNPRAISSQNRCRCSRRHPDGRPGDRFPGRRTENGERRTENGERRTENGERRTENGERRTENGERRTENGERRTDCPLRLGLSADPPPPNSLRPRGRRRSSFRGN